MARTESRTKTSIWSSDKDFRKRTGRAQRMYWFLYSQPTISLCGVLALTERRWADSASDETVETVHQALQELEENRYIVVDYDTQEVLVRTFAEHDGVGRSEKTRYPAYRLTEGISSPVIRRAAVQALIECGPPPPDWVPPEDVSDLFASRSAGCDGVSLVSDPPRFPGPETPAYALTDTLSPDIEISTDSLSDTPPDSPSYGVPDRTGGRARAVSVSSLRLQSPVSSLPPPDPPPPADGTGATHQGPGRGPTHTKLVAAVTNACTGTNRQAVATESRELVMWAAPLDKRIIEETLGWIAQQDKPPVLPRALAAVIRRKARDHGINLPEFQPSKMRAAR